MSDSESEIVQQLCAKLCVAWKWDRAVRKENDVTLQRAEMRIIRWMCGVKLQDRVPSKGW